MLIVPGRVGVIRFTFVVPLSICTNEASCRGMMLIVLARTFLTVLPELLNEEQRLDKPLPHHTRELPFVVPLIL